MIIPKVIESSTPYEGKIVTIKREKLIREPESDRTFIREVAVVSDSVGIVAVDDRQRVLLIRQYRHPLGRPIWEIPAGRMDVDGESPEETARRELREETDTVAEDVVRLTAFANSAGWTTEKTYVCLAWGLHDVPEFDRKNEEADIEKKWIPFRDALEMVKRGEIADAKSVIGITLASFTL